MFFSDKACSFKPAHNGHLRGEISDGFLLVSAWLTLLSGLCPTMEKYPHNFVEHDWAFSVSAQPLKNIDWLFFLTLKMTLGMYPN